MAPFRWRVLPVLRIARVRIKCSLGLTATVTVIDSVACLDQGTLWQSLNGSNTEDKMMISKPPRFLIGRAGKGMAVSTYAAVDAYSRVSELSESPR